MKYPLGLTSGRCTIAFQPQKQNVQMCASLTSSRGQLLRPLGPCQHSAINVIMYNVKYIAKIQKEMQSGYIQP